MKTLLILLIPILLCSSREITYYSLKLNHSIKTEQANKDSIYEYAVSVIKKYETFQPNTYRLLDDIYTGYGHKTNKIETWSEQKADSILRNDLDKKMLIIYNLDSSICFKGRLLLALLCYNCKMPNLPNRRIFKLIQVNAPKKMIQHEFYDYCHFNGNFHKGLFERRKMEFKIY